MRIGSHANLCGLASILSGWMKFKFENLKFVLQIVLLATTLNMMMLHADVGRNTKNIIVYILYYSPQTETADTSQKRLHIYVPSVFSISETCFCFRVSFTSHALFVTNLMHHFSSCVFLLLVLHFSDVILFFCFKVRYISPAWSFSHASSVKSSMYLYGSCVFWLNVLHFSGVVCIWSSLFLFRSSYSTTLTSITKCNKTHYILIFILLIRLYLKIFVDRLLLVDQIFGY